MERRDERVLESEAIIRIAIIGAGYMAEQHADALKEMENVKLVGVHSRTHEKAIAFAQKFGIELIATNIADLFYKSKADAVIVAVPELSVRSVCAEVFQFPWVSLIEKPAGYNFQDAEKIAKSASDNQCKAYLGLNRRHYFSTISAIEELRSCHSRRFIQIFDQEDQLAARSSGQPALVIDNWMYANSIHLIDYLCFLGRGEIENIVQIVPWNVHQPDYVVAKIEYSSGDFAIYHGIWNAPGPWEVNITTAEQRMVLRPLEKLHRQLRGSRSLDELPGHEWDNKFKPGIRRQAEELINAITGRSHNLPSLNDGLRSMALVKSIYGLD